MCTFATSDRDRTILNQILINMNANSTETPVSNLVFLAFLLLTIQVHASDTSIITCNMPYIDLFARAGKEKNR